MPLSIRMDSNSMNPELPKVIFFSVGEPSGDVHGGNLIRELRLRRPETRCVGLGGPRMREAGCELQFELTTLAVMGLLKVLPLIHKFWSIYRDVGRYLDREHVDAVVLIDFPGFNWWVAKAAKARGIPVYYYGAPQMWAWAPWRIKKMKRLVDVALCKLPFETKWYLRRGMPAVYVGHPFYDEIAQQEIDEQFISEYDISERGPISEQDSGRPLVLLLPGSRDQEINRNLNTLLKTASETSEKCPHARFAISCLHDRHAERCREIVAQQGLSQIEVFAGRTGDLMRIATSCVACSGSVSLELMYNTIPTIVVYRISRLVMWLTRLLVNVRYITLVNLLWTDRIEKDSSRVFDPDAEGSEPVPFPEYVTIENPGSRCAKRLTQWLNNPSQLQDKRRQLMALKSRVAELGASAKGAEIILELLSGEKPLTFSGNAPPALDSAA